MARNNAATRVLSALDKARGAGPAGNALEIWARALAIPDGPRRTSSVSSRLSAISDDIEAVRKFVRARGWEPDVWDSQLVLAEEALQLASLNGDWRSHRERLASDTGGTRTVLGVLSQFMPDDSETELGMNGSAMLRAQLSEFKDELLAAKDVESDLKALLLGLVEEMMSALDEAEFRRERFVRERVLEIYVRLGANEDLIRKNAAAPAMTRFEQLERRFVLWASVANSAIAVGRAGVALWGVVEHVTGLHSGFSHALPATDRMRQLPSSTETAV